MDDFFYYFLFLTPSGFCKIVWLQKSNSHGPVWLGSCSNSSNVDVENAKAQFSIEEFKELKRQVLHFITVDL